MTLPIARHVARSEVQACMIGHGLFEIPMLAGWPDGVQTRVGTTLPATDRLGHPDEYA